MVKTSGSFNYRWVRWMGWGMLGLVGVLLANTALNRPRPFDLGSAVSVPEVDAPHEAQRLSEAVQIATITPDKQQPERVAAMHRMHQLLHDTYPRVHQTLEREVVGGLSLLYRWPGTDPSAEPILLLAHMDVVPIEPGTEAQWAHLPFSGDIHDGVIWGRGTMDDKTGVMGILSAIEGLIERGFSPSRTLVIALGHDEETGGGQGAQSLASHLEQRGDRFAFVLDEGGAIISEAIPGLDQEAAMVGIAEKGFANIEVTLRAEGGHASMPAPLGAIERLARGVDRLRKNPVPAQLTGATRLMLEGLAPHMRLDMRAVLSNLWLLSPVLERVFTSRPATNATVRTTLTPTMLDAGVAANVLASEARVVFNARILPGDTVDDVMTHIREVIDEPELEVRCPQVCWDPSELSRVDTQGFRAIRRAIAHVYPEVITVPYLVVGATDARHYSAIARDAYRFLPMRMRAADRTRMHGTNEQNTVSGFADAVRFYMTLITLAAGASSR